MSWRASVQLRICARFIKGVASQVGAEEAAVFRAHEGILRDPAFTAKVRTRIADHRETAPAALEHVLAEYTALFTRMEDEYLRERLVDVRDVIIRLSGHLSPVLAKEPDAGNGPLILVAGELLPSQVVALGTRRSGGHRHAVGCSDKPCSHSGTQPRDSGGERRARNSSQRQKRRHGRRRRQVAAM